MRFVLVSHLEENMVLMSTLFDATFGVILGEGTVLTDGHIKRINDLGYAGVYVNDSTSSDILVEDVISKELRMQTIQQSRDLMQEAMRAGLDGNLHIRKERQESIILPVIDALISSRTRYSDMIDIKPYDDYDYYHTANSIILSLLLGIELGLSGERLYDLGMAALLHDIGVAFVPRNLLDKPGRLSDGEYQIIQTHTQKGFEFLKEHSDLSIDACMGALHHHENYDGSGYPNGLKRDRISIYGRIIAITDVFDAMISRRPYRQAMYPATAFEFLESKAGTIFDPKLVEAFKKVVAMYPTGCLVELNTGARCIVVKNHLDNNTRPVLRMEKQHSEIPVILDLKNDRNLKEIFIAQMTE